MASGTRGKPFRFEPHLEASGQRVVALTMLAKSIQSDRESGNISADRLDAYNRAVDRRDAFRNTALVVASSGTAFAAGGVLLYFFDRSTVTLLSPRSVEPTPAPKPAAPVDLTASPLLGPGLWGGSVTATF